MNSLSLTLFLSVLVLPQSLPLPHTFIIISKSCDHLNILYIVFSLYYQCAVLEHSNRYYVSHLFNLNLLSMLKQVLFFRKSIHISGFTTEVVRNTSQCYFFPIVWPPNYPCSSMESLLHCFKCPGNFVLLVK